MHQIIKLDPVVLSLASKSALLCSTLAEPLVAELESRAPQSAYWLLV